MITLRPKQSLVFAAIQNAFRAKYRAPLLVAPCGFGKTVVFSAIAQSAESRDRTVLILCHRDELIDQIVSTLEAFDVIPRVIAASYGDARRQRMGTITVASVQTLVRRLDKYPAPTLIIVDEAHHAAAGTWTKIMTRYASAKVLGVTASPIRADSRGLGMYFDTMILGPSVRELTEDGLLSPARVFAPPTVDTSGLHIRAGDFKAEETEALMDTPAITGDVLSHYRQHANGLPGLVFATSVAHAHHMAERFRKENIDAVALDGKTDRQLRRMAVQDFRDGKLRIITQCDLATEGWDLPGVHCGIFLRPTQSLGLWIQMMGRCSRIAPRKERAILLDHTGNSQRLGLPDEERDWELTSDIMNPKKIKKPPPRVCAKCFAASPARALVCIECKTPFKSKPRQQVEEVDGQLREVAPLTPEQISRKRERMNQGRSESLSQLIEFGKRKGYADGWAVHIWNARQAKLNKRKSA